MEDIDVIIEVSSELFGVNTIDEYFDVINNWFPKIIDISFYNLIIGNVKHNIFYRNFSPDFPTRIYADYSRKSVKNDLMLQVGIEKGEGSVVSLASLLKHPNPPPGWNKLVKYVTEEIDLSDTLALTLHVNKESMWGAGLTAYRVKPLKAFSDKEIETFKRIGKLFTESFRSLWLKLLDTHSLNVIEEIFQKLGNLSFYVDETGLPIQISKETNKIINMLYEQPVKKDEIPRQIEQVILELIKVINTTTHLNLVSKDLLSKHGNHRLYLSKTTKPFKQAGIYLIFFVVDPELSDLTMLKQSGFSQREIEIMTFLQRGLINKQIAIALGISPNTVKDHLKRISEKLDASGRTEILGRALNMARELTLTETLGREIGRT